MIVFLLFLFSLNGLTQESQVLSLEEEIYELLSRPKHRPDENGIDVRYRDFEIQELTLASLFIDAIKEQYKASNFGVNFNRARTKRAMIESSFETIFEPLIPEIISYEEKLRVFYSLFVNPQKFHFLEMEKLRSFEKLEIIRSQLLETIAQKIKGTEGKDSLEKVTNELIKSVVDVPGNKVSSRYRYIIERINLSTPSIRAMREELFYQMQLAETLNHDVYNIKKSLLIASSLDFSHIKPNDDHVVWTKLIQHDGGEYIGQRVDDFERKKRVRKDIYAILNQSRRNYLGERISYHYYTASMKSFIDNFLNIKLPLEIAYALRGLNQTSEEHNLRSEVNSVLNFLKKNHFIKSLERVTWVLENLKIKKRSFKNLTEQKEKLLKFKSLVEKYKLKVSINFQGGTKKEISQPWLISSFKGKTNLIENVALSSKSMTSYFKHNIEQSFYKMRVNCKGQGLRTSSRLNYGLLRDLFSRVHFTYPVTCSDRTLIVLKEVGEFKAPVGMSLIVGQPLLFTAR